ncbi:unnamed protein product [Rhizopus stolonifer]
MHNTPNQRTTSSINSPPKKKQRVIAADIHWCISNRDSLTLKSFADEFGLLDRQYAVARYTSIIDNRHFADDQEQLQSELNLFRKSEAFKLYWLERSRTSTQLDAHTNCAEYVHAVIEKEIRTFSSTVTATDVTTPIPTTVVPSDTISFTANDTTRTTDIESEEEAEAEAATVEAAFDPLSKNMENVSPLTPWIFKGVDVAELFTKFRQAVNRMSSSHLFFIESSIHELLALSNILFLCPGQHSPLLMNVFTEDVISDLNKELLSEIMDFNLDMTDDACMKLSRIINNVELNIQSKDDAEFDLLMLGKNLNSLERSLVRGIMIAMRKLPQMAIKTKNTIGECELFSMYFDPILSALLSDPDKNILLRWSNIRADETGEMRPDATISKLCQRDFGPSLGFGEVKLARPSTDNHALCHDLLRLAIFAKDTVDVNKLQATLTFQINGYNITFFMTRLRHDGVYLMQEIGQLTFPRSLEELASFVNLKNIRTLLMVTEAFWRLCRPLNEEEFWETKRRPTHPTIYSLIDSTKDRYRFCALRFE